VISKNGVGTLVTDTDFNRLTDVYDMRLKVAELIGCMNPVSIESKQIQQLQLLQQRAEKLKATQCNLEELGRINHQLHYLIAQLIGNSALKDLYDLYYYQTTRVWYQLMSLHWGSEVQALKEEIAELIAAMHRNDIIAVGYIKRNYIARTIHSILQQQSEH